MKQPPWSGDDEAMYRWCETMIDLQIEPEPHSPRSHDVDAQWMQWLGSDEPAIWAARRGDMTPLRKRHPELAEFLHPPKYGRGEHPRPEEQWKEPALDIIRRVRLLWSKHYKKHQRRRDDGITAIEIAARYLGLKPEEIAYWVKIRYRARSPLARVAKPKRKAE